MSVYSKFKVDGSIDRNKSRLVAKRNGLSRDLCSGCQN